MNQYEHLKKLENITPGPFKICREKLEENKWVPGYQTPLTEKETPTDHRTVLSNEIIFDIDYKGWGYNVKITKSIIDALEQLDIPYYTYYTGGKGLHTCIYFDKIKLEKEQRQRLQTAIEFGYSYKNIRTWFHKRIITEYTGLQESAIGKGAGKIIDSAPISFDETRGGSHLIRACGGRNQKYDAQNMESERFYKTWIDLKETKLNRAPRIKNIEEVQYPPIIKTFELPILPLMDSIEEYISDAQKRNVEREEIIKLSDGYLNLNCVKTLMAGMDEGNRSIGAQLLCQAIILDKQEEKVDEILKEYINNCQQRGHKFTLTEATKWYDWLKNQPGVFFNHSLLKEIGICDGDCEYNHKKKREVFKLLERKDLLEVYDNYLSTEIVGEEKNRILIFLLLLSCKFDTRPSYRKKGDPKPASIILSSLSSSGKSYVTKAILPLFGTENIDYFTWSRLTSSVLNYFHGIDMTGKIFFTEELQGMDAESNQLRLWISEGKLKLGSVEKRKNEEGIEVNDLNIRESVGQPAFITGTAEDVIEDQLLNRSWVFSMDNSSEQTRKILLYQDKLARGEIETTDINVRILTDAIKELKSYHIIIPWMDSELLKMPYNDVRTRRDYQKLMLIIQCSALLHQRQRIRYTGEDGAEYLIADIDDYEIAKKYTIDVLETTFAGLTLQQMAVYKLIVDSNWSLEFTQSDIQKATGWNQKKTWTTLKQLEQVSAIVAESQERGVATIYSLNINKKFNHLNLPDGEFLLDEYCKKYHNSLVSNKNRALPQSEVFLLKNGPILTFEQAYELWQIWSKIEKNTDIFGRGSPIKLILKALETGTRDHLPKDCKFWIGSPKSSPRINYGNPAMAIVDLCRISTTAPEEPRGRALDEQKVTEKYILEYMNSSAKHIFEIDEIYKLGVTEEILSKMKKKGDIYEPKPGRLMLL